MTQIHMTIKKNEIGLYVVFRSPNIFSGKGSSSHFYGGKTHMSLYPCIYRNGCLCSFKVCKKRYRTALSNRNKM